MNNLFTASFKQLGLLFTLFLFTLFSTAYTQTTLGLGDIAFTGYNSDNPDAFSFVLLKDIESGTTIAFTENGWINTPIPGFRTGEGTLTLTFNGAYSCGNEFLLQDNSPWVALDKTGSSAGTVVETASFALAGSGDQVFAYQGTAPTTGDASNWIAAIQMNGDWDANATSTNTSAQPSAFTDGVNSISIAPEQDNAQYNCSTTGPDAAAILAAVTNSLNWSTSNSRITPSTCGFSCGTACAAPVATCQDLTVQLDAFGNANITVGQINNGSSADCELASMTISLSSFGCSDVSSSQLPADLIISEYIEGSSNNKAIEIFNGTGAEIDLGGYKVQVYSNGSPTPKSTINLSGPLANGAVVVAANTNANAAILAVADFKTGSVNWNGDDAVVLKNGDEILDIFGRIGEDPGSYWTDAGMRTKDRTLRRKNTVIFGVTTNPGSGFPTLATEWEEFPQNDSDNLGAHSLPAGGSTVPVTLTVTDINGQTSSCIANITVEDNVPPTATCQDVTVQLDAEGNGSITAVDVDNGSSDACGIANLSVSPSSFTCANIGATTTTLTATDLNGNIGTCIANIIVEDNVPPAAICQGATVQLDASGNGSISVADINAGSVDACGLAGTSIDINSFVCGDVGASVVASDLFVSEYIEGSNLVKAIEIFNGSGAAIDLAAGEYKVEVYFNGSPNPGATVNLTGTIADGDVHVLADDGADQFILDVADQTTGSSLWNGDDAIVLKKGTQILDIFGNIGQDPGSAWTGDGLSTQNRTLRRKAFVVSGVTANPGSGFPTLTVEWDGFNINDADDLGNHSLADGVLVTMTATASNSQTATCSVIISVEDNVPPVAVCQDFTIDLDAQGTGSITAADIDGGSSDACGIANVTADPTSFGPTDTGDNPVTLTVTDNNGNSSTCVASVTAIAPPLVISCPDPVTIPMCSSQSTVDAAFAAWIAQFTVSGGCNTVYTDLSWYTAPHACGGYVGIDFYASGDCGQMEHCYSYFHVEADDEAPTGICPEGLSDLATLADVPGPDPDAVAANYTDNCGSVHVNLVSTITNEEECEGFEVYYIYEVSDDCYNKVTCIVVHEGGETPLTGTCPEGAADLECHQDIPDPDPDLIASYYTGTGDVTAVLMEVISTGEACDYFSETHVYEVSDDCESLICEVTYSGRRVDFSLEGECPDVGVNDLTCIDEIPAPNTEEIAINFTAPCGEITVTLLETIEDLGDCSDFSVTYVYGVYNECCKDVICEVTHSGTSELVGECVPNETGFTCIDQVPAFDANYVASQFHNSCGGAITATLLDTYVYDWGCMYFAKYYYYKVEDACGNMMTCLQKYTGTNCPGCGNGSKTTLEEYGTVNLATPIAESNTFDILPDLINQKMMVYPNPTRSQLNVLLDNALAEAVTLEIRDINGRIFYSQKHTLDTPSTQIDLDGLNMPSGLYLLSVRTKGALLSKRFVKE